MSARSLCCLALNVDLQAAFVDQVHRVAGLALSAEQFAFIEGDSPGGAAQRGKLIRREARKKRDQCKAGFNRFLHDHIPPWPYCS
jgi:hypothetical protein